MKFKRGIQFLELPEQVCIEIKVEIRIHSALKKKLVAAKASDAELRQVAVREGMTTLREDAWAKVRKGVTTVEEALRVTSDL